MPSRRRIRARTCERKRRYETSREAEDVARHRRQESGELDLEIYPCAFCDGWHIGHAQPRRSRL